MPRTWKEWLKIAEERGLKAYGHVVMTSTRTHFRIVATPMKRRLNAAGGTPLSSSGPVTWPRCGRSLLEIDGLELPLLGGPTAGEAAE
jgi:hypothetical protein